MSEDATNGSVATTPKVIKLTRREQMDVAMSFEES